MAQYRPSSLIPSTLTPSYSIDATVANSFRCQINGTSPTTKYRLKILKNDSTSTPVYDSGIVTLTTPLFPVSYDGTPNELIVSVPSTSGMVNGTQYKWAISSYWSDTLFLESYENVFNAYSSPTLVMSAIPAIVASKDYIFTAVYTQAQGITIEKFGWQLRNADTHTDILNTIDSNNIYSADLKLPYDGLFSGTNYEIRVKCWLANGIDIETEYSPFSVQYVITPFTGDVTTRQTCNSGILIEWPNVSYILGTVTGNYSFQKTKEEYIKTYCLDLPSGSYITYDNINRKAMSISSDSSHIISFFMERSSTEKVIYSATGVDELGAPFNVSLKYTGFNFSLSVLYKGITTTTQIFVSGEFDFWFVFGISPGKVFYSTYSTNMDGLYPSPFLYPSTTLYPKSQTFGPDVSNSTTIGIPKTCTYNSLIINGASQTNYLWVTEGSISQERMDALKTISVEPTWTNDTILLATFNQSLGAGNYVGETDLTKWLVYRQDTGSSVLKHIFNVMPEKSYVIDYSVTNQSSYTYYIFPSFVGGIGDPMISGIISVMWWDWVLMVCDPSDDKNTFYVDNVFRFDLDLTSGAMSNNTSFSVLENFTRYSKIQHSNSNYWTGTLTALLGNCAITYSDTVEKMNEIKALTTDGRTKFLKDRKGNLWKVRISAPVSEQIGDAFREQQVSVTLNWMEVGDANSDVIVESPLLTLEEIQVAMDNCRIG